MAKKMTIQKIADRLGLSVFAVSTALSGKEGVSEETRKKVIETAHLLGYRVKSAKTAKPSLTNTGGSPSAMAPAGEKKLVLICVKTQARSNSYWDSVISGVEKACHEYGWNHLICSLNQSQSFTFPEYIQPDYVAGIILVGTFATDMIVSVKNAGLPLILVDHEDPVCSVDCVVHDNIRAGKLASRHLLEAGEQNIIFIGNNSFSVSFRERWLGCFLTIHEETEIPARLWKWEIPYGSSEWKNELSVRLNEELPEKAAFICANDQIAIHLLQQLKMKELPVPSKYKVAGCDDNPYSPYTHPPLTTVHLSKEALGFRAVVSLLQRIQHPNSAAEKVVVSTELIARESTMN